MNRRVLLCVAFLCIFSIASAQKLGFRFAHALPDGPSVDVLVDGDVKFRGMKFAQVSNSVFLEPADYDVVIQHSFTKAVLIEQTVSIFGPTTFVLTEGLNLEDPTAISANYYLDIPTVTPSKGEAAVQVYDLLVRPIGTTPITTTEVKRDVVFSEASTFGTQTMYTIADFGFQNIEFTTTGDSSQTVLYVPRDFFMTNSFYSLFLFGDYENQSKRNRISLATINDNKHLYSYNPQ